MPFSIWTLSGGPRKMDLGRDVTSPGMGGFFHMDVPLSSRSLSESSKEWVVWLYAVKGVVTSDEPDSALSILTAFGISVTSPDWPSSILESHG